MSNRSLDVAAVALNQTPLDWRGNAERIRRGLDDARAAGAQVVCFPEMCIPGYGCEDMFLSGHVVDTSLAQLAALLPHTHGMIAAIGLPLLTEFGLLDAAAVCADGALVGFAAKQHLASDGLHYEPRWFKPAPPGGVTEVSVNGARVPAGDLVFQFRDVRIGFEICEDTWAPDRPAPALARRGVDLILNPSASHFAFGKIDERRRLILEASHAFGIGYVYANLVGNEAGRTIYDGGSLVAQTGALVAQGPRLSFRDVIVTTARLDLDAIRMARTTQNETADHAVARHAFLPEPTSAVPSPAPLADWESGPHRKAEEFARAVSLGLYDSMRKSRSRGFIVSLSGGADSAAVACLASMSQQFAALELDEPVAGTVTCAYQSTENSSETTESAARAVAEAIGADFHHFDVDPIVRQYRSIVETALDRALTWEDDDIALQNIQARVRGPGVWMLANLRGALLLATSNRSEAAVGYTTMDGDTCGGLSPIAGVDKAYLREWLRWLETDGPEGLEPVPALAAINELEPTAELRPPGADQRDESDLMPYDVLDRIERLAIRDRAAPLSIYRQLEDEYAADLLLGWIIRFFRLWSRNQWKRERYAPSYHLDDENLDPKTWCRFPILSGGFEWELEELARIVAAEARA